MIVLKSKRFGIARMASIYSLKKYRIKQEIKKLNIVLQGEKKNIKY